MYVISLSILVFYFQYVLSNHVLYETGFNHLKELYLDILTSAEIQNGTKELWIEQKLDHFDANSSTWQMRYFEKLDFFNTSGPIFIFLGGEGEANTNYLSYGVVKELAQETGGAMYMTEHRYYGESKPFDNYEIENMKWLSSKQALADIAHLIENIKSNPTFQNSKVVVIGGSYAGNLAAWMRLKYPELVDAAIASSGPVLAKTDFYNYIEKVSENYENYGTPDCMDKIRSMFKRYQGMLKNQIGIELLKLEQNICRSCDLNDIKNKWVFFQMNISPFMSLSQYGGPSKIKDHCSKLGNGKLNITEILKDLFDPTQNCNDVSFDRLISYLKTQDNYHSWYYQVCTEFGYFQTTSSDKQPFGHVLPKEYQVELCKALFGPEFDEERVDKGVKETNDFYGGLNPPVEYVVFSNGDMDPWSTISVLEDLSYEAPAVVIPRATHCADLFVGLTSSEELKEAHKNIKYLIKSWIGLEIDDLKSSQ